MRKPPKAQTSFRIDQTIYEQTKQRSRQHGFPSVASYVEALMQCALEEDVYIVVSHGADGKISKFVHEDRLPETSAACREEIARLLDHAKDLEPEEPNV